MMKKNGFTLAEVLITLAIIGIVAAIAMPTMLSSYQYKTVGVKLSKFISTTEAQTRAYVISNDSFKADAADDKEGKGKAMVTDFVNESFIFKKVFENGKTTPKTGNDALVYALNQQMTSTPKEQKGEIGVLKDNTSVSVVYAVPKVDTKYNPKKFGSPIFTINYDPKVKGLPKSAQKTFNFVVTDTGYIVPAANDPCLEEIYNADWVTTQKMFQGDTCSAETWTTPKDDEPKA